MRIALIDLLARLLGVTIYIGAVRHGAIDRAATDSPEVGL
jgi:hypothetical protein